MFPVISRYNAMVAMKGEQIALVNGDADSKVIDGFCSIQESNDLGFSDRTRGSNTGDPFNDDALADLLDQHRAIEVLDLRNTAVSSVGLRVLAEASSLRWLAVDARVCDIAGVEHLSNLPQLERLFVDGDLTSGDVMEILKRRLESCEVRSRASERIE